MRKFLSVLLLGFVLSPVVAFADGDCFPSVGDIVEVRRDVALKSGTRGGKSVDRQILTKGTRLKILRIRMESSVQVWARVQTADQQEGWVFGGYWSSMVHGRANICPLGQF